jgi:hypothetical protein
MFSSVVRDSREEQVIEGDGQEGWTWMMEEEGDDGDKTGNVNWSEHVTQDDHKTILPRVSRLRLRIMEGVAFTVLVSNATHWAHLTAASINSSQTIYVSYKLPY